MLDTDYPYYPQRATDWVAYFERNASREAALRLDCPTHILLPPAQRAAMVRTLRRFHLGESGEGTYLKRFAASCGDASYQRAIELFVAEEQAHSRWFGCLLGHFEAAPLQHHWSDAVFTSVRRVGGLHFELITFLTAEIIAQRFLDCWQNIAAMRPARGSSPKSCAMKARTSRFTSTLCAALLKVKTRFSGGMAGRLARDAAERHRHRLPRPKLDFP